MNNPFRIPGEVPVYPKEETPEEKAMRLQQEAKRHTVIGSLAITAFPSGSLMIIGILWGRMTSAEACTSVIATAIMSIGVFIAIGTSLNWFSEK